MPNQIMRQNIDNLMPDGSLWQPKTSGDFDHLLEGIAKNWEPTREKLFKLGDLRNPWTTEILEDLEREFGITTNFNYSLEMRRTILAQRVYTRNQGGTIDEMQKALTDSGFNVFVYPNDPAVDPAQFLTEAFFMTCGADNAYAGEPSAICGAVGGELLVNGPIYLQSPAFGMVCGSEIAFAGEPEACAGFYDSLNLVPYVYEIPTDPTRWPFIFFVGGVATFGIGGELTDIAQINIPPYREQELKNLILRLKPMHSWAALVISFN